MKPLQTSWIGVDWGTSNLRVFAIDCVGNTLDSNQSDQGMSFLQPSEFEPALLELIEPWLKADGVTPVYACGMVGARQGWQEALYRVVPSSPVCKEGLVLVPTHDNRIAVHILPGLSQQQPGDVMRGEETQLAGLIDKYPAFKGSVCLPGTHSKWVSIGAGQVISFKTFMTGELYALLGDQSVLRHSVNTDEWDNDAFRLTALEASNKPERTLADLFTIRANSLLSSTHPAASRAKLSAMLIGYELGMTKTFWKYTDVVLIGAPDITRLYQEVLLEHTVQVTTLNAKEATLAGLGVAAKLNEVLR